ncbi:transposase family protein [Embleya sp. NPDC127516]|uniref:transposase family protein n=1 Tax=Embleya sp. NPDC127516 TaxID=3363990 RepID=UPI0038125CD7
MLNANELVGVVFSGLGPLVVEEADEGEIIRVRARTPAGPVDCPDCGGRTGRVHAFHERTVTDVPVDARRVVVSARLRRLVCPTSACPRIMLREQVATLRGGRRPHGLAAIGRTQPSRPRRSDAYTDDDGVVFLDVDEDVEVVIDGVVLDGEIYDAYIDERGRLRLDE